jgi:hypothetical protein
VSDAVSAHTDRGRDRTTPKAVAIAAGTQILFIMLLQRWDMLGDSQRFDCSILHTLANFQEKQSRRYEIVSA